MPFYERQPYIQPLYQLILDVMSGNIRVPRFQRPGTQDTWDPEQRQALLDSLYRGYPIGTILLWTTNIQLKSHEEICGHQIPETKEGKTTQFLLDGHQRLSSLVQILGNGLLPEINIGKRDSQERWYFDVSPQSSVENSIERFIWLHPDKEPEELHLPLDIVLNRSALNRWVREREDLTETQVKEVDDLRDRLREYNIPVAILLAETLEDATESFKRINSSGTPMGYFNMVTALAYQENFDPQERFAQAREKYLNPIGWEDVSDSDILRVCVGIFNDDPTRLKVDELAKKLKGDNTVIDRAVQAIKQAALLLRGVGVHGPVILPYTWQLIVIAIVLSENSELDKNNFQLKATIEKWFWLTTYGEVFASGNKSVVFRNSKLALSSMLQGKPHRIIDRYTSQRVYPLMKFDFRAARSKACLLAMAHQQDQGNLSGPAHLALARGKSSIQLLSSKGLQRSIWWHLAIVENVEQANQFRDALTLKTMENSEFLGNDLNNNDLLEKIGIPLNADGDLDWLLGVRKFLVLEKEEEIVTGLGMTWVD